MEFKSSIFTAEAKYSGKYLDLQRETETKLVRDKTAEKKKGVEQLSCALSMLISGRSRVVVEHLDLSGVKRVYPLLITLDNTGSTLVMTRLLNTYFDEFIDRTSFQDVNVTPLFCTDIEAIEAVLAFSDVCPLNQFLQHWLDRDSLLLSTLLASHPPGLPVRRNQLLGREWDVLHASFETRLFPDEFSQ